MCASKIGGRGQGVGPGCRLDAAGSKGVHVHVRLGFSLACHTHNAQMRTISTDPTCAVDISAGTADCPRGIFCISCAICWRGVRLRWGRWGHRCKAQSHNISHTLAVSLQDSGKCAVKPKA